MTLLNEIQRTMDGYVAAWRGGDQNAILDSFAPDAVFLPHDGVEPRVGREAMRAFWFRPRPTSGIDAMSFELQDCDDHGDAAIAWGRHALTWWQIEAEGKATYSWKGTVLVALQRKDTRWLMTHLMVDDPAPTRTVSAA